MFNFVYALFAAYLSITIVGFNVIMYLQQRGQGGRSGNIPNSAAHGQIKQGRLNRGSERGSYDDASMGLIKSAKAAEKSV